MNFKRLAIIFLVFFTLTISIGVISAAENDIVALEVSNSNLDTNLVSENAQVVPVTQNNANANTQQTTPTVTKQKIKTKVEADPVAVAYKKKGVFKIQVEDRADDDIKIKNVKLKVKIGTGSKAKTFNVKTNSYGIAKINTKSLKIGTHKVVITSDDDNYEISKTSKIFVGKQYKVTLKGTSKKTLKNKDIIALKIINDFDEKEVKIVFKKNKHTKILKAKFYFKNKNTGETVIKTDKCEFDDGKWELPDEDFSKRYSLVKVKVYYISTK